MRKVFTIAIPVITMLLFILIMQSGSIIKKSLGKNEIIEKYIEDIIIEVNNEDWAKVNIKIDELEKTWKQILLKIQFSSERDEINLFDSNIARMRGAVSAEDRINLLIELNEAKNHWDKLGE